MITKNDCLSILLKLEDRGINIDEPMKTLLVLPGQDVPLDVLSFLAKNQGFEAAQFYEMLRRKHNVSKSKLYTAILDAEKTETQSAVTTLICLLTQIILYGNKLNAPEKFYKEIRADEISRVINEFFVTGDVSNCNKMLKLIKTDLLVLEGISGKREFNQ